MIEIIEIKNKQELKKFINFPFKLYKNDQNWVPPLKLLQKRSLSGKNNPLFMTGSHAFFLAYRNAKLVGRVLTGINAKLNDKKNKKEGYISMFESIDDKNVAFKLLDKAIEWLKERGMETVVGPVSPSNGDDLRGLLIKGFDGPPVLLNSYNPKYYVEYFEEYGFEKDMDLFAFDAQYNQETRDRFNKVINYAMKKFKFHIDNVNMKKLKSEILDIKQILDEAMPDSWGHMTPPSYEELLAEVKSIKMFIDPNLVFIARNDEGKPISFVAGMPDYNQVLIRIKGRLFPFGIFKFLYYRKKINRARLFVQFVVPSYKSKAVNGAIFYRFMELATKEGYTNGAEGSTVSEMNTQAIRSIEGAGGNLYRIYRIYRKKI